jgi:hypothetical protein
LSDVGPHISEISAASNKFGCFGSTELNFVCIRSL